MRSPYNNVTHDHASALLLSDATVGSGGNYTTLKAAFDAINSGTLTGPVVLRLISSTIETTTATLNASGTGLANYSSVNIYATGAGYSISGNVANPLINLNGADNVVIDGRVNATGTAANLAITNTNTGFAACTLRYINSAENNIVKYTTLSGSGSSAATAIVYFISSAAGNGNDSNIIEYCNITNASGNRPLNAILSYGTAGRDNSGNTIRFNDIYNVLSGAGTSYGLNLSGNSTDWNITGNSFYETAALTPTGNFAYAPVKISTASPHTVAGNFVGGSAPLCAGSPWTMNTSFATTFSGFFITGNTSAGTLVQNNTVKNFSFSSTSANPWDGIYLASGNMKLSGNTIGEATGVNSIVITSLNAAATATITGGVVTAINLIGGGSGFTAAPSISFSLSGSTTPANVTATISGGVVTGFTIIDGGSGYTSIPTVNINGGVYSTTHGIRCLNSATVTLEGNSIGSITTYGNAAYSHGFEAIVISGPASSIITVSNNLIGSLTTAGSIKTASPAASSFVKQDLRGIYINSAVNIATITGNTIANLTSMYTGNSTSKVDGIYSNGNTNIIQNNTVRDLGSSSGSVTVRGIQQTVALPDGNQSITGNTIYNLSNTHPTAPVVVAGIDYSGSTTGINLVSGNFIYGLSVASGNLLSEIDGILLGNGVTTTSNNIINLGVGIANGYKIYGINDNSSNNAIYNNNIYFNSIYIGGTVSGITASTAAFWNTNNTSIRNYRNNIFVNARTGGTTGKHYAVRIAGIQGLIIDYNDYYVSTGGVIGSFNNSDKTTLAAWKTATAQDVNSLNTNPLFNIAGGNAPLNYYTSAILPAGTGTAITTDYTGVGRSSLPKMGALETNTNVWSGATSNDFATASNWQSGLVPTNGSDISFAASPVNHCLLDQDRSLRHITNAQGAYKLSLNGHQLTVTGNLIFSNNAKIDATSVSSILEFGGAIAQNLPAGSLTLNTMDGCTINNIAGVTLNNDITIAQPLTLTSGALILGANTLNLNGIITATLGTLEGGSTGNIIIGGSGAASIPSVLLNNLTVNRSTGLNMVGSVAISGTLALTSGTLAVGANTLTMSGNSPTRVNGNIDASNTQAMLAFTNTVGITVPNALFTGNLNDLTINGTGGVTSAGNFGISGVLDLQSNNPSATKGALDMLSGTQIRTLTMGSASTTTGTGDTTGIIRRTSISAGISYTFGNQFMKVYFANTGALPTQVSLKVSIGTAPLWKPGAIKRVVEVIQTGAATTSAVVTYHYLDSELNGNIEENLVLWAKINDIEYGASAADLENNWVSLSNVNLAFFSSAFDGVKNITLDEYSTNNTLIWNGSLSTSWTSIENWTPNIGPSSTKNIVIPDASTTPNDPVVPTVANIKTITIEEGGILNAVALAQLTIDGASAWNNSGIFNANTSTVIFNNAGSTISGTTNFNNVTVNTTKALFMTDGCGMRISGAMVNNGTWNTVVSGATFVEYNGAAQTIVNPNGSTPGYHNLILSGSGTKTMPATLLTIYGNLNLLNAVTATAASAFGVNGNLVIGEGATFGTGNFNHAIKGDFDNSGIFTSAAARTIILNGTVPQSILGTSTSAFERLTINNTNGITLYSNVTVANLLTLSNGTFNVEAATLGLSGVITKTSGFIGITPFSSLSIGGSGAIAFADNLFSDTPVLNNLTVNRSGGVTLGQDMGVDGILNLAAGTLNLAAANLTLGTASSIAAVSPGTSKMIIANGTGELRKILTTGIPFTYPVGDNNGTPEYSPVTLTLEGDNIENNYFGVKLADTKHPDNASTTNYLNRCWSVTRSGALPQIVNLAATYTAADISGTVTNIAAAKLDGVFNRLTNPWVKYGLSSGNTLFIPNTLLSAGKTAVFTGISSANPTVTIQGTGNYCSGSNVPLEAIAVGEGTILYNWTPPDFLSSTTVYNPVATNITAATTYTVTIHDENGISANSTGTINTGNTTTWSGVWSNGAPIDNVAVILAADYTAPASFSCCSLTVTNNAQVIIPSGINITLQGALTVTSGSFTIANNANLLQTTDVANSGNIIVLCNSAPIVRLDHTLWSSPVTGTETLQQFSPNTLSNRFYTYNSLTNGYSATPAGGTFPLAKAIAVRAPNNWSTTEAFYPGSFTGIPNNGTIVALLDTSGPGYNGIGNPYPSALSGNLFVAQNSANITGTLYFYAHTLLMNAQGAFPAGTNYAVWNPGTGGTPATVGGGGTGSIPAIPDGTIQTGQGFLVKATAPGSVTFNNSMRIPDNSNRFFRDGGSNNPDGERHRIWLQLSNDSISLNTILIGYVDGATSNVDYGYDGLNFGSPGSELYSIIKNNGYTIQGRGLPFTDSDTVPLGFEAAVNGAFSISIYNMDGLFTGGQEIFIQDNILGTVNDITTAPYHFVSEEGIFNDRFNLIYTDTTLNTSPDVFSEHSVLIYHSNNTLFVQAASGIIKTVRVFDLQGRLVFEKEHIDSNKFETEEIAVKDVMLLVQVTDSENKTITKKVLF